MKNGNWKYSIAVSEPISPDYPSVLRGSYSEAIIKAKEIGFHAVEIHTGNPRIFPVSEIQNLCHSREMEISAVSSGISYSDEKLSLLSRQGENKEKARSRFKEYIDLCSDLDCMLILGLMRGQLSKSFTHESAEKDLEAYLHEILKYAEKKNVMIVLEAINRYLNNFLMNVNDVVNFVKKIDHPLFKAHIDTFHMNIEDQNLVNAIHYAGDSLGYIHFSDSNRKVPGFGHIDFYAIARALKQINYKDYITIESIPYPNETEAAELSIAFLRNLERVV